MTDAHAYANGDSIEYWKGAEDGRLLFQKCRSCGKVQFPPRHHCSTCWTVDLDWTESLGTGKVESFTVVRRAPLPDFRDSVPYVVASILVTEGPRMISKLVGEDALDVNIGDDVKVTFEEDARGNTLPVFQRI